VKSRFVLAAGSPQLVPAAFTGCAPRRLLVLSLYGHTVVPRLKTVESHVIVPMSTPSNVARGPETKINIDAIPGDGGRVRWDAVRRPHPDAIVPHCQPATEERGAVQSKVEAEAVVFDNERTNPKRADDAAGPDDDPERTICNGDGALTEDV
jgi:hypothetical protein